MSFPFSSAVRSSLRVAATALLLLFVFSPAGSSSAAEVTLAGKYSLQLPAGWKVTLTEKRYLAGEGPGVLSFSAGARSSDQSPEKLLEEDLRGIEKTTPGYKLLEKSSVKDSAGRNAHILRYEQRGPNGSAANVEYYFQLVEKEIVLLRFTLPNFSSKVAKTEIEAILDSVKVATAAAQDDSWLTAPADKPKESSKAAGAGDSEIVGKYVSTQRSSDYIMLKGDGTFSYQISGESGTSTYTRNGATITLKFGDDPDDAKLEKDALVDSSGKRWVRSTAPADKSKESSKATGAGDSEIAGKYVSSQQSSDYIILKADGTLSYQITGESGAGTYTRKGATITLNFGDDPDDAKLEKDALVDSSGKRWVRSTAPTEKPKGDSKPPSAEDSKIVGKYVLTKRPTDYIVLRADGTFTVIQEGETLTGTYSRDGATVSFKFSRGSSGTCKIEKDALIDQDGDSWVKKP